MPTRSSSESPSRFVAALWLFQVVALVVLAVALLFAPWWLLPAMAMGLGSEAAGAALETVVIDPRCILAEPGLIADEGAVRACSLALARARSEGVAEDAARTQAPLLLGIAVFTVFALMREDQRLRNRLAQWFSVGLALWLYGIVKAPLWGIRSAADFWEFVRRVPPLAWAVFGLVLTLLSANVAIRFRKLQPRRTEEKMRGTANTMPAWVWAMFIVQGICFAAYAWFLSYDPSFALDWLTKGVNDRSQTLDVVSGRYLAIGSSWVSMALLSWFAASLRVEWAWRSACYMFVSWMLLWVFTALWIYDSRTYHWWMFAVLVLIMAGFIVGHLMALGFGRAIWSTFLHTPARAPRPPEEVGQGPDGWQWRDLLLGPALLVQMRKTRRRATHAVGMGGTGEFLATPDPNVPASPFFSAGATWPVVFRCANLTKQDDRSSDIRGFSFSLRNRENRAQAEFDMLLNSGPISAVANVFTFMLFAVTKRSQALSTKLLRRDLVAREASIAGARLAPSSVLAVHYYSQIVRYWVEPSGTRWRVRYRVVPLDDGEPAEIVPESGLLPEERADKVWERQPEKDAKGNADYLTAELESRLKKGPARLAFEAQFALPMPEDETQWYNATVDWPERCHPWCRIGVLTLEKVSTPDETERLEFNAANHPAALPVPVSDDITDYRSLGDVEGRVIRRLQRIRAKLALPPPGRTPP